MDKTTIAVSVFNKNAAAYAARFMDVSLYQPSLDIFLGNITKPDASILDMACGPGNVSRYLLLQRPGFRVLGIDLSENMLALARENNPGADFQQMDCRDISQLDRQYDAVVCSFALPYLSPKEAAKLIKDIAAILKPGGTFYLSTMEGSHNEPVLQVSSTGESMYLYYHRADGVQAALEANGFRIIDMRRQPFPANEDTDLVIVAENKR